ncbi:MAG: energy transducer TonB [Bacteroidia bacterium]
MEPKKNKNKQVERHSGLYTEIGLLVALLLVFSAFKWKAEKPNFTLPQPIEAEPTIMFDPPATKEPEPEPMAPKPEPKVENYTKPSTIFKITTTTQEVPFDTSAIDFDPTDIDIDELFTHSGVNKVKEPTPSYELTKLPSFPGGNEAYFKFLKDNIEYPEWEHSYGIGGVIHLKFEIDKKGNVSDVIVVKGATENLNNEALRVAKQIPKWNPGLRNGKAVSCWFYQKIVFKAK